MSNDTTREGLHIGPTEHMGEDLWLREIRVAGVTLYVEPDQAAKAKKLLAALTPSPAQAEAPGNRQDREQVADLLLTDPETGAACFVVSTLRAHSGGTQSFDVQSGPDAPVWRVEVRITEQGVTERPASRCIDGESHVGACPAVVDALPRQADPADAPSPSPAQAEGEWEIAEALVREYRPTMDRDVLHQWAIDAVEVLRSLTPSPAQAEARKWPVPPGWLLVPMEAPEHALGYLKVPSVGNWQGMLSLMPVPPKMMSPAQAEGEAVGDGGLADFTEYFVRNYPGPDTVIFAPRWHAPRIFRAAQHAIDAARAKESRHG